MQVRTKKQKGRPSQSKHRRGELEWHNEIMHFLQLYILRSFVIIHDYESKSNQPCLLFVEINPSVSM